jgi:hypothetical protein
MPRYMKLKHANETLEIPFKKFNELWNLVKRLKMNSMIVFINYEDFIALRKYLNKEKSINDFIV